MHRRYLTVCAALILLVFAGCETGESPVDDDSESASERGADEPDASTDNTLEILRSHLDEVERASGDEHVSIGGETPLDPLLGKDRETIREALGEPNRCAEYDSPQNVAPCETEDDWFYSFYSLPEGWSGGGPELLLQFDDDGECTRAVWRFTQ